jgi:glucosamine--fructose-6-phosphate aminotransferase (isomerizing)
LPQRLAAAAELDWSAAVPALAAAASLVTIGRGSTLAIAREAALKLTETCNRHTEAFSGAEFLHGPVALASSRYPVLMFMPTDAAAPGMRQLATNLRHMGTGLFVAEPGDATATRLPTLAADQPEADAVCMIQSFYGMAVQLAQHLEIDIDRPPHLRKVTSTT